MQSPASPQTTCEVGDSLRLSKAGTDALLTWSDEGGPGSYRLYRGFRKFAVPPGYNHVCVGGQPTGNSTEDILVPPPGTVFFYLVGRDDCADPVLGRDGTGQPVLPLPGDVCDGALLDRDGDGAIEAIDNCPGLANPNQSDVDSDGHGDACDNCLSIPNVDQSDLDHDGVGDVCDPDIDGDGIPNAADNCPILSNSTQSDADGDGIGDDCDSCPADPQNDEDRDRICGDQDNCPTVANPEQVDTDQDGVGDICENCATVPNPNQADTDGDSFGDTCDNCPLVANADQHDGDHDGIGDLCDNNLDVQPSALGFGSLTVGTTSDLPLRIQNAGPAPRTLSSVTFTAGSDQAFSITNPPAMPVTLNSNEILTVNIRFSPTASGEASGGIRILLADATLSHPPDVPLSGIGLPTNVTLVALHVIPGTPTRAAGECVHFQATADFSDGTTAIVTTASTWQSGAPSVASVDSTGLAQALSPGQTTISASYQSLTAQAPLAVVPAGSLRLQFPCGQVSVGGTVVASLRFDAGATPVGAYAIKVRYNPGAVRINGISGGATGAFTATPGFNSSSFTSGVTTIASYQNSSLALPTGSVELARVTFEVVSSVETSTMTLEVEDLVATDLSAIPRTTAPATLEIQP
jgi:hypothetical protein